MTKLSERIAAGSWGERFGIRVLAIEPIVLGGSGFTSCVGCMFLDTTACLHGGAIATVCDEPDVIFVESPEAGEVARIAYELTK